MRQIIIDFTEKMSNKKNHPDKWRVHALVPIDALDRETLSRIHNRKQSIDLVITAISKK